MAEKKPDLEYPAELEKEINTYFRVKGDYVADDVGNFLLIKGENVIGVFESENDALREGFERFGTEPFLVKQITELEPELNFTANMLDR